MSDTVGGPTLHTIRGPATNVVLPPRLRRTAADTTFRRLENTPLGVTPSRSGLKRKLPSAFSAILLFVGSIGWCWPVFNELRSPVMVSPAEASIHQHISRCQRPVRGCARRLLSASGSIRESRSCRVSRGRDLSVRRRWTGCATEWPLRAVRRVRAMRAGPAPSNSASAL